MAYLVGVLVVHALLIVAVLALGRMTRQWGGALLLAVALLISAAGNAYAIATVL